MSDGVWVTSCGRHTQLLPIKCGESQCDRVLEYMNLNLLSLHSPFYLFSRMTSVLSVSGKVGVDCLKENLLPGFF